MFKPDRSFFYKGRYLSEVKVKSLELKSLLVTLRPGKVRTEKRSRTMIYWYVI